jgi:two-component system OmpR family response regulator
MKNKESTRHSPLSPLNSQLPILLVEDEEEYNDINGVALRRAGFDVLCAETFSEAKALIESNPISLIVMDIMLPDGSGLELCRSLREEKDIPVLFLSALSQPEERVAGLKAGGDDYLPKPYYLEELVMRVRVLLRRAASKREDIQRLGDMELHHAARRATRGGKDLLLTPREFSLLALLAKRPGEYLSSDTLYKELWGFDALGDIRTVKTHMYRLRRKLGGNPPICIESSHGKGYRLIVR